MFKSRESKNCPSLVTKSDVLELKFDCSNAQKTVCSNKSMFIALQGWWRFPYSSSGHRWLPVRTSFYDDPNLTSHFIHYDQTEVRTAGQEATPIFYVEVNAELNWTKVEDWTTSCSSRLGRSYKTLRASPQPPSPHRVTTERRTT